MDPNTIEDAPTQRTHIILFLRFFVHGSIFLEKAQLLLSQNYRSVRPRSLISTRIMDHRLYIIHKSDTQGVSERTRQN